MNIHIMSNRSEANDYAWIKYCAAMEIERIAAKISDMPSASSISMEQLNEMIGDALIFAACPHLSVSLRNGNFTVEPFEYGQELYYSFVGEHEAYGDFAVFWSARGPGEGARHRPCFAFWGGQMHEQSAETEEELLAQLPLLDEVDAA
ncbi:hypothetical protein AL036_16420 [Salipiger aestuarii]|uniref:hypothetical protein n=1 Tax=Salipiger aestuarii TaxID=568098 RepID=UPI0012387957|nr:hypothetical protein [Salipiger aestuarii]KAA8606030.1 hypothetical protein AL036_16420 [Salipiger aestuarii]